jgi:hypothetical protein
VILISKVKLYLCLLWRLYKFGFFCFTLVEKYVFGLDKHKQCSTLTLKRTMIYEIQTRNIWISSRCSNHNSIWIVNFVLMVHKILSSGRATHFNFFSDYRTASLKKIHSNVKSVWKMNVNKNTIYTIVYDKRSEWDFSQKIYMT